FDSGGFHRERRKKEHSNETHKKTKHIADFVVRSLSPYYSTGAFKDRETFKDVARELTRRLVRSGVSTDVVEQAIGRVTSRLVAPYRQCLTACDSPTATTTMSKRGIISSPDDLAWTDILSELMTVTGHSV
uniref:DUF4158 domain-containing protein n=1 Tax=Mesocestoides corti TaxID=53468 RepID=A0A5K3FUP5_MESCO